MKKSLSLVTFVILIIFISTSCTERVSSINTDVTNLTITETTIPVDTDTQPTILDESFTQITGDSIYDCICGDNCESMSDDCNPICMCGCIRNKADDSIKNYKIFNYCEYSDEGFIMILGGSPKIITDGLIEEGLISYDDFVNIVIPNDIDGISVTRIGAGAFIGANAKSVIIPETIEDIGMRAFAWSKTLESVTFYSSLPPKLEYEIFHGNTKPITIYILVGSIELYNEIEQLRHFKFAQHENGLPVPCGNCNEIVCEC